MAMRSRGTSCIAFDTDNVGNLHALTVFYLYLAEMTVVIIFSVSSLDADILSKSLRGYSSIFPAGIMHRSADCSVNFLAVNSYEVETVVNGIPLLRLCYLKFSHIRTVHFIIPP